MDGSPRHASLVVASDHGRILGVTDPRPVAVPWWPETPSLIEAFGDVAEHATTEAGLVIVRLLRADRRTDLDGQPGWHVTYLSQIGGVTETDIDQLALPTDRWPHTLIDDPLRMPWAEIDGPAADLAWAHERLATLARPSVAAPRQHKTWNLSSVWELPTGSRGDDDAIWLKTVAPFSQHEAIVLELLADDSVPTVLAAEGHRQLLEPMAGRDGFGADLHQQLSIVDSLVDEAIRRGVPAWPSPVLAREMRAVIERRGGHHRPLRRLAADLDDRLAALDGCGLPAVVVHGDAHPGNARVETEKPILFDWSDSFIGHPLWDLRRVLGPEPEARAVRRHWLDRWAEAVPGSDPDAALELIEPLAPLLAAVVYQRFVDGIEAAERIYHQADIDRELDLAAAAESGSANLGAGARRS